jgi:multidrug efflux pump subunit AcrA (membrane-fusion protein)
MPPSPPKSPSFEHDEALARLSGESVAPVLGTSSTLGFAEFAGLRGFAVASIALRDVELERLTQASALVDSDGRVLALLRSDAGELMLDTCAGLRPSPGDPERIAEIFGLSSPEGLRVVIVGERTDPLSHGSDPSHEHGMGEALRSWLHVERSDIRLALVFGAAASLVALAGPIATQGVVTAVSFGTLQQPLLVIATLLFAILTLSGTLSFAQQVVVEMIARRLFVRTALDIEHVSNDEDPRHEGMGHQAPHFAYVHEVFSLQKTASTLLVDGSVTALKLAFAFVLIGFYHPYLLAYDALCIGALWLVVRLPMRRTWKLALETSARKYEVVHDLEGLVLPRVPGADYGAPTVGAHLERWLDARARAWRQLQHHNVGAMAVAVLMVSGLLLFGGLLVLRGELSLGQLVAAELLVTDAAYGTSKLGKLLGALYDAAVSAEKLRILVGHAPPTVTVAADGARARLLPVRVPRAWRTLGRLLVAALAAFVLVCACVPWQQTAKGQGRVIAFAPDQRLQELSAPLDGRVVRWAAVEGQHVSRGDAIAVLSDNDPAILARIRAEADAQRARIDAARSRVSAVDERIVALTAAREAAMGAATERATMARERVRSAEQALEASRAASRTAAFQRERQRALFADGLASRRAVELADLDATRTTTEVARAEVSVSVAERDAAAAESDRARVEQDTRASLSDAQAQAASARGEVAAASAELARIESRMARQDNLTVSAPIDGVVHRIIPRGTSDFVKAGETLATIVPDAAERAVELLIDGNDVPLVQRSEDVRLQFEGWPAVQFSGWPSIAVGTFGGKVRFVDATDNGSGKFRIVVTPAEPWPDGAYLRQGARAQGWVLMRRVSVGYELWRQFNGFPPSLPAQTSGLPAPPPQARTP